jgi:hypothetical protein
MKDLLTFAIKSHRGQSRTETSRFESNTQAYARVRTAQELRVDGK